MRNIGSLDNEKQARSLHSYLLTENIRAMVEEEDDKWQLWIFEEDDVERGRSELAAFRSEPDDPKYAVAVRQAEKLAKDLQKKLERTKKQNVDVRVQRERPLYRRAPVSMSLIILSILACAVLTDFSKPWPNRGLLMIGPAFCNRPASGDLMLSQRDETLPEVRGGEAWRLITPIFMHLSFFHLVFNMLWVSSLGSAIEMRIGRLRYLWLVVFTAIVSLVLAGQTSEGPFSAGMSGVIFGFIGYVYIKGRYQPHLGIFLSQNVMQFSIMWIVLGFLGVLGSMSNFGHLFGLLSGGFFAYVPIAIRRFSQSTPSE